MTTELPQPTLSAGQILRQAREQQNLSVAQVAQQLNLSRSLVEDLEQDQVDAKLSSTFVRGYLRSYAKLLKLPAQQILEAYNNNSKGLHQVPSLTRSFSKRTTKEATENRFMWVTYFVVAVFVVLLVLGFWQSRFGGSTTGAALPMAQTDETMLASEAANTVPDSSNQQNAEQPSIPVTQIENPSSTSLSAAPQTSLVTDAPVVLPAQDGASQNTATVQSSENTATQAGAADNQVALSAPDTNAQNEVVTTIQATPIPATQTPVSQPEAASTQPAPANSTAAADVAAEPTTPTISAENTTVATASVSLSLSAECWVDVVDATGKRLVFGSRKAGEQLNVRGVAPIKVLLGNAAAATLSFNGESVDLSGYPTGRVARLTLGQN